MPLQLKSGAIFLHIPKTGGTWIERVLKEQNLIARRFGHSHADMDRTRHLHAFESFEPRLGKLLNHWARERLFRRPPADPFYFCFVRHPLKWYESWFRWRNQLPGDPWAGVPQWHMTTALKGACRGTFSAFIRSVIARRPGFVSEMYYSFTRPGIRFIGRQENLADDLITVLRQLNENFDEDFIRNYGRVNQSREKGAPIAWDPKLECLAVQTECTGLAHYGYLTREQRHTLRIADEADLGPSPWLSPNPLPGSVDPARLRVA
jgi:hypothetical protein